MNDPIEVEVLEIDGQAPSPVSPAPELESKQPAWQTWQGRIRRLDGRWWPLWVILGVMGVALLLTVGIVFGVIVLVARTLARLMNGVFSLFAGPVSTTTLRR
ncbi:MAG TPA: hypothetical protein VIM57_02240 [Luteolibacter sp.]